MILREVYWLGYDFWYWSRTILRATFSTYSYSPIRHGCASRILDGSRLFTLHTETCNNLSHVLLLRLNHFNPSMYGQIAELLIFCWNQGTESLFAILIGISWLIIMVIGDTWGHRLLAWGNINTKFRVQWFVKLCNLLDVGTLDRLAKVWIVFIIVNLQCSLILWFCKLDCHRAFDTKLRCILNRVLTNLQGLLAWLNQIMVHRLSWVV